MPLVEYKCKEHGSFDKIHNIKEEYKAVCPVCKKKAERLWGHFGIYVDFKDGWDGSLMKYVNTKRERDTELDKRGWGKM